MDRSDWGKSTAGGGLPPSGSDELAAAAPMRLMFNRDTARADYIAYIADMVQEMSVLAERTGCPTLAGILNLAHSEALRESRRP